MTYEPRTTPADRARLAELCELADRGESTQDDFDHFSLMAFGKVPALLADVAALETECQRLAGERDDLARRLAEAYAG